MGDILRWVATSVWLFGWIIPVQRSKGSVKRSGQRSRCERESRDRDRAIIQVPSRAGELKEFGTVRPGP